MYCKVITTINVLNIDHRTVIIFFLVTKTNCHAIQLFLYYLESVSSIPQVSKSSCCLSTVFHETLNTLGAYVGLLWYSLTIMDWVTCLHNYLKPHYILTCGLDECSFPKLKVQFNQLYFLSQMLSIGTGLCSYRAKAILYMFTSDFPTAELYYNSFSNHGWKCSVSPVFKSTKHIASKLLLEKFNHVTSLLTKLNMVF